MQKKGQQACSELYLKPQISTLLLSFLKPWLLHENKDKWAYWRMGAYWTEPSQSDGPGGMCYVWPSPEMMDKVPCWPSTDQRPKSEYFSEQPRSLEKSGQLVESWETVGSFYFKPLNLGRLPQVILKWQSVVSYRKGQFRKEKLNSCHC